MKGFIEQGFNQSRIIIAIVMVISVIAGVLTIEPGMSYAQPVACEVGILKEAIPSDGTVFSFVVTGADVTEFELVNGQGAGLVVQGGVTAEIVEEPQEGWVLADVVCEAENTIVTEIENGVQIFCSPNGGAAGCTFINEELGNIPTLSQWGMIAAAAGLGLVAVFFALKRKRTQAV